MTHNISPTPPKIAKLKNLLVIAGAGRNVGKTTTICQLIKHFSQQYIVYALKVSAIYPDETMFHGNHDDETNILFEEKRRDTSKDTSKMLVAGAQKVFYLKGDGDDIRRGFHEFQGLAQEAELIICESNSLHQYITPGMHVLIAAHNKPMKPRAQQIINEVDLILYSSENSCVDHSSISYDLKRGWHKSLT